MSHRNLNRVPNPFGGALQTVRSSNVDLSRSPKRIEQGFPCLQSGSSQHLPQWGSPVRGLFPEDTEDEFPVAGDQQQVFERLPDLREQRNPLKVLAAYGRYVRLEGQDVEGVVIAEFPSLEDARNWYESPAYREAALYRHRGAVYRGLIVEGV